MLERLFIFLLSKGRFGFLDLFFRLGDQLLLFFRLEGFKSFNLLRQLFFLGLLGLRKIRI